MDDLNNWEFCDPDARVDLLPQPFRFIDEIIEDTLMRAVNKKIEEIDELKTNPSYEGHVPRTQPSGAYEMDGITCISQEEHPQGYVMAGDQQGIVYLLDVSNKARLARFDTKEKKPVTQICLHTVKYGDKMMYLFFVVWQGKAEVEAFMMASTELSQVKKVFSFGKEPTKPVESPVDPKKASAVPAPAVATKATVPAPGKKPDDATTVPEPVRPTLDGYPMVDY